MKLMYILLNRFIWLEVNY